MTFEPIDWNIVILGAWNLAILTPKGLAKRILNLPEGVPIQVLIPLDSPGSAPAVRYEGCDVVPSADRLIITPAALTFDALAKALVFAQNGLKSLPETPYRAMGFNVRYQCSDPTPEALTLADGQWEDLISDAQLKIVERRRETAVEFGEGLLNTTFAIREAKLRIELNFDLQSTDQHALLKWASQDMAGVKTVTDRLIQSIIEVGKKVHA